MSLGPIFSCILTGVAGVLAGSAPIARVGVVITVDREGGRITLVYRGGLSSCLTAHPSLLKDVRIGGPVQVVTDGRVIQSLRRL